MPQFDMATKLLKARELVSEFRHGLQAFQNSSAQFQVLKTFSSTPDGSSRAPSETSTDETAARSLFILDSSFNPPHIAHRTLAASALTTSVQHPGPARLLLLFGTSNADKAPAPAAFEQRLTMMAILAQDLLEEMQNDSESPATVKAPLAVDIGVTTVPYYTDKTAAIERDGQTWYPGKPRHVHLLGYDTLIRFFAAKYYPKFDPPLSAVAPFFAGGHCLRATLRPNDDNGTVEQQEEFLRRLARGELEGDGASREWAKQVELVPPNPKAGVSSTKIRTAVKDGDWDVVRQLCTPGVAAYLEANPDLYAE